MKVGIKNEIKNGIKIEYVSINEIKPNEYNPKKIDKSEIIAKKQKVNLELFNEINQKITEKKEVSNETLQNIRNPF